MNQLLQGNWKPHMVAGLNWSSCCSCHCFFGLCMQNSKVYVYVNSRDGGGKWKSTQACTTAPFVNYIICIPSRFASRKMKGKIIFINKIGKQKFILKKLPKLYFLYRLCIHDILYDLTRPLASVPSRKPQLWPFRYLFWLIFPQGHAAQTHHVLEPFGDLVAISALSWTFCLLPPHYVDTENAWLANVHLHSLIKWRHCFWLTRWPVQSAINAHTSATLMSILIMSKPVQTEN